MLSDLITPAELARKWKIKPKTLDNWRSMKVGPPYVKVRGVVRYSEKAADGWLVAQNEDGGAA